MLTCAETSGYIGTHTHIHADVSTHLDARIVWIRVITAAAGDEAGSR